MDSYSTTNKKKLRRLIKDLVLEMDALVARLRELTVPDAYESIAAQQTNHSSFAITALLAFEHGIRTRNLNLYALSSALLMQSAVSADKVAALLTTQTEEVSRGDC